MTKTFTGICVSITLCFSILVVLIVTCMVDNKSSATIQLNTNPIIKPRIKSKYEDKLFNLYNFNYSGECAVPFKYKPNNKRDLLIYGVYFSDKRKWNKQQQTTLQTLSLNQNGIPNATKILLLCGEPPEPNFSSLMNSKGVEVIPVKVDSLYNGAVLRYVIIQKYLEENKEKYDRVFIADLRDVVFFEDGFATFSDKQLYLSKECSRNDTGNISCASLALNFPKKWMRESVSEEVAELYAANKTKIINSGTIFGGIEQVLHFLQIFTSQFNYQRVNIWGYDQSLLNYMYYSGQFNSLNITIATCDQMFCFDLRNGCYYNKKEKSLTVRGTNCSPIIRHKIVLRNPSLCLF
ncbi:hypothetical protein EDI_199070 [Entamoeba dispar SAW760]|uniref:Uncharacterized protein n=1 Tax=Entamoeba dispar (strain ATCC PRA-260 / SAW760) TaxID=370354 RepID=B0EMZ3_ENTDS|nr:uncharacterized protein EDI_199070 [Entamoeba dispar SAW760]EDR24117.1 hypothetical protein EDI_199070 [Entamoeba dispar SAW760]|eukprot:EDR24117.1 hypothetical protein EDI_199070 [Entamoeba dispar SAW760]